MIEKRCDARVKTSIEITCRNSEEIMSAHITDISIGGVFLQTDKPLPIDTELSMRFMLPDDSEIMDIIGRVAWLKRISKSSPAGMGIELIRMSYEHMRKIKAFVEKLAGEPRQTLRRESLTESGV